MVLAEQRLNEGRNKQYVRGGAVIALTSQSECVFAQGMDFKLTPYALQVNSLSPPGLHIQLQN